MLEIKPLTYFIAAYEEKSISAAAIRCFIAQPSISHAIKTLEEKLNQRLFTRSKSGIIPTSYGNKLYKHAKALIEHSASIEQAFIQSPSISINIYFQGDIRLLKLQPVLAELQNIGGVQIHRVSELNQADIAIIDGERVGKRFDAITLYEEGFSVLMANHHPLAVKSSIHLHQLSQYEFIERPYCSQRKAFQAILKAQAIELNLGAQADNDLQVMELVALGFGIAALPSERAHVTTQGVMAKSISLDFQRSICLAHRSSRKDITDLLNQLNWEWIHHQLKAA